MEIKSYFTNKNIIMSSFKSSRDIKKKEGGPDTSPCFFLCTVVTFYTMSNSKLYPTKRNAFSKIFPFSLHVFGSSNFINKIVITCRFVTKLQYDIDEYPYVNLA